MLYMLEAFWLRAWQHIIVGNEVIFSRVTMCYVSAVSARLISHRCCSNDNGSCNFGANQRHLPYREASYYASDGRKCVIKNWFKCQ